MKDMQAIQMIGTQRSGSNLLRVMLNQFKEVSAPHPPHILQRFYPLLSGYGDLELKENMMRLIEDVCQLVELNPVKWEQIRLDRNIIFKQCKQYTLTEIFRIIYEENASSENASIWVCKSMANIQFADQLESDNLDMKYIYLYRDGRDVACSFKKAIVGEKHVYHIAKQWAKNQQACLALINKFDSTRFLSLSYENIILHPEIEMKRVSEFLNIDFNPQVFDFYKSSESKNTASAGEMWENVSKPILSSNFNKYKKLLTSEEIKIFEKLAGKTLQTLGYQTENSDAVLNSEFSEKEIDGFNLENEKRKTVAKETIDLEGQRLRDKQSQLLERIKSNHTLHK